MNKKTTSAAVLVLSTLLVACGGGGGGDDGNGNSFTGGDSSGGSIALTSQNAEQVSAVVIQTAFGTDDLSSGIELVGVVQSTDGSGFGVEEIVAQLLSGFEGLYYTANALSGVVIPAETTACFNDIGTMTVSGEVSDSTMAQLSNGDFIRIEYDNCSLGEGVTLDGLVTGTFDNIEGDVINELPPYSLSLSLQLEGFSISSVGETVLANGSFTASILFPDAENSSQILEGQSLSVSYDGQTVALRDFRIAQDINLTTEAYSRDISGVLQGDVIGGSVEFTTVQDFEGSGFGNPETGELLITGASNSTVRVFVVDAVNLSLEVDSDGDGTVDNIINTTWDELLAL